MADKAQNPPLNPSLEIPYLHYALTPIAIGDKKILAASKKLAEIFPLSHAQSSIYLVKPGFWPGLSPERAAEKAQTKGLSPAKAQEQAAAYRKAMAAVAFNAVENRIDAHLTIVYRAKTLHFLDHLKQVMGGRPHACSEGTGINSAALEALLQADSFEKAAAAAASFKLLPQKQQTAQQGRSLRRASGLELLAALFSTADDEADAD